MHFKFCVYAVLRGDPCFASARTAFRDPEQYTESVIASPRRAWMLVKVITPCSRIR